MDYIQLSNDVAARLPMHRGGGLSGPAGGPAPATLPEGLAHGFAPELGLFGAWFASVKQLISVKQLYGVDRCGWRRLTRWKSIRLVEPDRSGNMPMGSLAISPEAHVVHRKVEGCVRVLRMFTTNDDAAYWSTSELSPTAAEPAAGAKQ